MAGVDISYSNPNRIHGCHPQSRQSHFESIDLTSPHQSTLATLSASIFSDACRTDSRGVTLGKFFRWFNRVCYPGKQPLLSMCLLGKHLLWNCYDR